MCERIIVIDIDFIWVEEIMFVVRCMGDMVFLFIMDVFIINGVVKGEGL